MSTASSKQKVAQLKEWLLTLKTTKKPSEKSPKRNSYGQK